MAIAASAIIAAKARRKVARDLRAAGAIDEASAISVAPLHPAAARRQFDRLVDAGAVRKTLHGFYWLDEATFGAVRLRRLGVIVGMLGIAAGLAALVLLR